MSLAAVSTNKLKSGFYYSIKDNYETVSVSYELQFREF
jgi:hypothetical protein